MCSIVSITPETDGYPKLLLESMADGHRMLARLKENWLNGGNRFDRAGEMLVGALLDGRLAGVCGRNIDPYSVDSRIGRVRHLYVGREYRRHGIGGMLIRHISSDAVKFFDCLNTRAPAEAFAFYERLGFVRVEDVDAVTHSLSLPFPSESS
jgi:GNAT superfamily N-acetyltransferase